jgi:hypothetical protein
MSGTRAPVPIPTNDDDLDVVVRAADLMVSRLDIPAVEVFEKLERVARTAGVPVAEAARRLTDALRHEPVRL